MSATRYAVALSVVLTAVVPALGEPTITINEVPPYCDETGLLLKGEVSGVEHPEDYVVAPYIQIEGVGWYTKPTFANPTVPVGADGKWEADVVIEGTQDCRWTQLCVNLMEAGGMPDEADGLCYQPVSPLFLANDTWERYYRTIEFSGYTWGVKESPVPVGPGSNRFGGDSDNVWVDGGKLHLTIQQKGGHWYSSEVICTEGLGYGDYLFQTSSRVDNLDSNAIFGAFTWECWGDPSALPGQCNREIDFEDGRWGDPTEPLNSQFVVQPDAPHRFSLPDLSEGADLTRILKWEDGRVTFILLKGHHTFDSWDDGDVIKEWWYVDDPDAGHHVPEPGDARWRFNLWLIDGLDPAGDGELEVVVDHFAYVPEPTTLGLLAVGGLGLAWRNGRRKPRPRRRAWLPYSKETILNKEHPITNNQGTACGRWVKGGAPSHGPKARALDH